jgi:hypothetical protein
MIFVATGPRCAFEFLLHVRIKERLLELFGLKNRSVDQLFGLPN